MALLRFTLVADGSSDEVLMPILVWLIEQHRPGMRIAGAFARLSADVGNRLPSRLPVALRNFPCDLCFVHRDAEGESYEARSQEIGNASAGLETPCVPVIPVRMTEAWLFSDERAIRFASGNASGRLPIGLPNRRTWEVMADPKQRLFTVLCEASGRSGRALRKFSPERARSLITSHTENFAGLRGLASFDALEANLVALLKTI
jgi:hypothetical protein